MAILRHQDQEMYGRMEFLAYSIIALALIGMTSIGYFLYGWLLS